MWKDRVNAFLGVRDPSTVATRQQPAPVTTRAESPIAVAEEDAEVIEIDDSSPEPEPAAVVETADAPPVDSMDLADHQAERSNEKLNPGGESSKLGNGPTSKGKARASALACPNMLRDKTEELRELLLCTANDLTHAAKGEYDNDTCPTADEPSIEVTRRILLAADQLPERLAQIASSIEQRWHDLVAMQKAVTEKKNHGRLFAHGRSASPSVRPFALKSATQASGRPKVGSGLSQSVALCGEHEERDAASADACKESADLAITLEKAPLPQPQDVASATVADKDSATTAEQVSVGLEAIQ